MHGRRAGGKACCETPKGVNGGDGSHGSPFARPVTADGRLKLRWLPTKDGSNCMCLIEARRLR
jgi:hypothetical protein